MATRATIALVNEITWETNCFYNHWDGYISGLWLELVQYIMKHDFTKWRNIDFIKKIPKKFEDIQEYDLWNIWDEFVYEIIINNKHIIIQAYYNFKKEYTDWKAETIYQETYNPALESYILDFIHIEDK